MIERKRFYGMVDGEIGPTENPYTRLGLILDCTDANLFDEQPGSLREPSALTLVRLLSTPRRLASMFGLARMPREGDWLEVELEVVPGAPRAWTLSAVSDYSGATVQSNLVGMQFLADSGERRRATYDAMSMHCTPAQAADNYALDTDTLKVQMELNALKMLGSKPHIRARDVGQASCNVIHAEEDLHSPILGYFDVGSPLFCNNGSFPSIFREVVPEKGFVFLSHWDLDHYALALRQLPELAALRWYAPLQPVGPNAARFQRTLGSRLKWLSGSRIGIGANACLYKGLGASDDRNGSGYALRLGGLSNGTLMTADIAYDLLPPAAKQGLSSCTIPHHGGFGSTGPITGKGLAVASYGKPNRYRHPDEVSLTAHIASGWQVRRTAAHAGEPRGCRWL